MTGTKRFGLMRTGYRTFNCQRCKEPVHPKDTRLFDNFNQVRICLDCAFVLGYEPTDTDVFRMQKVGTVVDDHRPTSAARTASATPVSALSVTGLEDMLVKQMELSQKQSEEIEALTKRVEQLILVVHHYFKEYRNE